MVKRGGGEELVFRCPIPNDPRHFPSELSDIVISNRENASVALESPLECVTLWVNHLMTSGPVEKKSECAPGFDDYDALVADLAGTNADRQGMSVIAFCWLFSLFFFFSSLIVAAKPLVQRRYEKSYRLAPFSTHFGMPVNRPSYLVYE